MKEENNNYNNKGMDIGEWSICGGEFSLRDFTVWTQDSCSWFSANGQSTCCTMTSSPLALLAYTATYEHITRLTFQ